MMTISEHTIQSHCVAWFAFQYPQFKGLLFAIPNGGHRSKAQAGKLRAEGTQRGVADLFLSVPSLSIEAKEIHGLYIEMKNATGRQTAEQAEFQKQVQKWGYQYRICRSLEEFQKTVSTYISTAL
jgi:hypothetical protein